MAYVEFRLPVAVESSKSRSPWKPGPRPSPSPRQAQRWPVGLMSIYIYIYSDHRKIIPINQRVLKKLDELGGLCNKPNVFDFLINCINLHKLSVTTLTKLGFEREQHGIDFIWVSEHGNAFSRKTNIRIHGFSWVTPFSNKAISLSLVITSCLYLASLNHPNCGAMILPNPSIWNSTVKPKEEGMVSTNCLDLKVVLSSHLHPLPRLSTN